MGGSTTEGCVWVSMEHSCGRIFSILTSFGVMLKLHRPVAGTLEDCRAQIMAPMCSWLTHEEATEKTATVGFKGTARFEAVHFVLVVHGAALKHAIKRPAFRSIFKGPCRVIGATHPQYRLRSVSSKLTRSLGRVGRLKHFVLCKDVLR